MNESFKYDENTKSNWKDSVSEEEKSQVQEHINSLNLNSLSKDSKLSTDNAEMQKALVKQKGKTSITSEDVEKIKILLVQKDSHINNHELKDLPYVEEEIEKLKNLLVDIYSFDPEGKNKSSDLAVLNDSTRVEIDSLLNKYNLLKDEQKTLKRKYFNLKNSPN